MRRTGATLSNSSEALPPSYKEDDAYACVFVCVLVVCRHVTLCHTLADLAQVREPKVCSHTLSLPLSHYIPIPLFLQAVLASVSDLECGFSRDLFVQWASNPKNSIILTSRPAPGCLAHALIGNLKIPSVDIEVEVFTTFTILCILT